MVAAHRAQLFVLGLLIIGLAVSAWIISNAAAEGNPFGAGSPGELVGDVQFGQTFVAAYPDLCRIDVMLSADGGPNTHQVILHLREDVHDQADILSVPLDVPAVKDGAWQSFTFPPLPDSAGRSLYFYLEAPASQPGDALSVMGSDGDPYRWGQGFINRQPASGDMTFRVYYQMGLVQKIGLVTARLAANKPAIWGRGGFYLVLVVGYVLLLGALLWKTSSAQSLKGEGDGH
jgi:hypothetical protein